MERSEDCPCSLLINGCHHCGVCAVTAHGSRKGVKADQASFNLKELHKLQRSTFGYFLNETNRANGLVPDSTRKGSHSSIAAIGFGLAAYTISVERSFITRIQAVRRTLTTLRFFWNSPRSEEHTSELQSQS